MPKRKFIFSGVLLLAVFVSLCSAISESEIQRLARAMNWKAGQAIADVGAGEGEIGFAAAAAVGETGKVYLTHTVLNGRFTLRFCVGQTNTELEHVRRAWELVQEVARLCKAGA